LGNRLNTQPAVLTQQIKQEAKRLGFDLVGVTTPHPPPHLDVYRQWLDLGRHGEMAYLAKETAIRRRSNPPEILPECKSILVTGMKYFPSRMSGKTPTPRISSYALGEDYHEVIIPRLEELMHYIHRLAGSSVPYRIYTDTGPLLERELAQRAGFGWIGKNTCLIHPQLGSYFFLGEIMLGLELAIDEPFEKDQCGTCTRCIEACPTRCIMPDRTLDAQKCISYLTIEMKDAIPRNLRPLLGDWIFGCDICQEVCPWNVRFAQTTKEAAFQPDPFLRHPSLSGLLQLTLDEFRIRFGRSPLKRSKWSGILRNAAVVAGNRGEMKIVPFLVSLLMNHPASMVRSHAAWALGRIGGLEARGMLEEAKVVEKDLAVLDEIIDAIQAEGKSS
jgi:epoxyqueuosine reductase